MPPKKSKPSKSEESVSSAAQNTFQDGQLTGVFVNDFPFYCTQNGLPLISVKTMDSSTLNDTQGLSQFCLWCKPEVTDDPATKKMEKIIIRGWKVTEPVIIALRSSLQSVTVNEVSLWQTGLDDQTIVQLTELIPQIQCRALEISGSKLCSTSAIKTLLLHQDFTNLVTLNLKCCELTDDLLVPLVEALKENPPLRELDLSNNKISDKGVEHLVDSLRMNRNIFSLSLLGNRITDSGAVSISLILKEFPLQHSEIVARRKLFSAVYQDQWADLAASLSRRSSSRKSISKENKIDTGKKPGAGAMMKALSFIGKTKKGADQKRKSGKVGTSTTNDDKALSSSPSHQHQSKPSSSLPLSVQGPLVEGVEEREDGTVICLGNFSIIYISLAYNHIDTIGLNAFLTAVQYQNERGSTSHGSGLLNLNLTGNSFNTTYENYETLQHLLASKSQLLLNNNNK